MSTFLKLSLLTPLIPSAAGGISSDNHFCDRNPGFSCSIDEKEFIEVQFDKSSPLWKKKDQHTFSLLTDTYPIISPVIDWIPENVLSWNPKVSLTPLKDKYPMISPVVDSLWSGNLLSWIPKNIPFSLTYSEEKGHIEGPLYCFESTQVGLDTEILRIVDSAIENAKKAIGKVDFVKYPTTSEEWEAYFLRATPEQFSEYLGMIDMKSLEHTLFHLLRLSREDLVPVLLKDERIKTQSWIAGLLIPTFNNYYGFQILPEGEAPDFFKELEPEILGKILESSVEVGDVDYMKLILQFDNIESQALENTLIKAVSLNRRDLVNAIRKH